MDMPVTSSARVTCRDASWPLSQLTLAGMSWSSPAAAVPSRPLVLLHGWLDNCLSFTRLAPELASLGPVHAIDMAGHGHSGHRSPGQSYWLMDYVSDLAELLEHPLCPGADDGWTWSAIRSEASSPGCMPPRFPRGSGDW